jgi:hypothetical protein
MRTPCGLLCFSLVLCAAVLAQTQKPAPPVAKPSVQSNGTGGSQEKTSQSKKPQTTAQEAYSFMGLTLRQAKAEATAVIEAMNVTNDRFDQFEPQSCVTDAAGLSGPGLEFCYFHVKYATLPAYSRSHSFSLLLVDDKVAGINYDFDRNGYEAMVQAIVKKYGAPKSSRNVIVQNQMGATFRGKEHVWTNAVSQIRANEYSSTLEKSVIHVEDLKLMREFEKRARDNGPKI